ncbi:hypothetical protein BHM03_00027055 [Ensete ventricosum]|uniref:Uncharacterized protein n=1 Tax=Ensete ventricosum TaxID=4639 RepID=A0A426XP54_ENSVE|nr:hypothetical protein B296_00057935 [Ensete ventricosum]RZR97793.1 hypothetical protein BHM03_00027055 [Ensete ventricosum]
MRCFPGSADVETRFLRCLRCSLSPSSLLNQTPRLTIPPPSLSSRSLSPTTS